MEKKFVVIILNEKKKISIQLRYFAGKFDWLKNISHVEL